MSSRQVVGVIGTGNFGLAIANLLAINHDVLIYARREDKLNQINQGRVDSIKIHESITATDSLAEVCHETSIMFPVVPSLHFRSTIRHMATYLSPRHILIHGTKGLDIDDSILNDSNYAKIKKHHIRRMSEVIVQESAVLRVGCISGPNLAKEIHDEQPSASVVASDFDEVISVGQSLLNSDRFFVFGSHDLIGTELAGSLKNIAALGSGLLAGKGLGLNTRSLLLTRVLHELIYIGQELGSSSKAFLGTAGIGDIIATSLSTNSRNYSVGYEYSQGRSLEEIIAEMDEVAEGLHTLKIAYYLSRNYKLHTPVIDMIYTVIYKNMDVERAIEFLMRYPYNRDVDFI